MTDHRDLVIEELADSEAAQLDRIVDLTIERDAFRLLAQQAIHLLHTRHVELQRLREHHHHLLDAHCEERRGRLGRRSVA